MATTFVNGRAVPVDGRRYQVTGTARGDVVAIARNVTGDPLSPNVRGEYSLDRVTGLDCRNGARIVASTRTVPEPTLARGTYPAVFRDGNAHTYALTIPGVARADLWRAYRAAGMPTFDTLEDAREFVRPFRVGAS